MSCRLSKLFLTLIVMWIVEFLHFQNTHNDGLIWFFHCWQRQYTCLHVVTRQGEGPNYQYLILCCVCASADASIGMGEMLGCGVTLYVF